MRKSRASGYHRLRLRSRYLAAVATRARPQGALRPICPRDSPRIFKLRVVERFDVWRVRLGMEHAELFEPANGMGYAPSRRRDLRRVVCVSFIIFFEAITQGKRSTSTTKECALSRSRSMINTWRSLLTRSKSSPIRNDEEMMRALIESIAF